MLKMETGLPIGDIVLVIDVPVDVARRRENAKDLYEEDKVFQEKVRNAYLTLADQFDWKIIDGDGTIKEIAKRIWTYVSEKI